MEKMTVGGEEVWYKYHPHHPQNSLVRQAPEPPRLSTEVPRRGGSTSEHRGSAEARADKNSARLAFLWLGLFEM